jgi:hypothetical protein
MPNAHVDLSELHQVLSAVQVKGAKVSDQIGTARQAMNSIIRSEALQGKTGATIVAGINDVHSPILLGLEDAYTLLVQQMKQAISDFKNHLSESSDSAVLDQGTLQSVINLNNRQNTFKAELDRNLRRIYNIDIKLDDRNEAVSRKDHKKWSDYCNGGGNVVMSISGKTLLVEARAVELNGKRMALPL